MKFFKRFAKASTEAGRKSDQRLTLKEKYAAFQNLLKGNDHVHGIMADLEEKLSGEYLFDKQYLHASVRSLSDGVFSIIESLDTLSRGKFKALYDRHHSISREVEQILSPQMDIPASDLVISLEALRGDMSDIAGGKLANLGEVKSSVGIPAPEGFSITAYAFKRFMEHNRLSDHLVEGLSKLNMSRREDVEEFCRQMRDRVARAELPAELQEALRKATEGLRSLSSGSPRILTVSVRSSAVREDGELSFAGQYATFLNVPEDLIAQRYKDVIASLFSPRAVFYYKSKGFSEPEMVMAVGVLNMVDAKVGGVMYTRDPNDPDNDTIIINALRGLGKAVVDGAYPPCSYLVSHATGLVRETRPVHQTTMLVCTPAGDIREAAVPAELRDAPCLTDAQLRTLSEYAAALEKHYRKPQDIEWAIDQNDQISVLQSRPLKVLPVNSAMAGIPRRLEQYPILIDRGLIACKGIGQGRAFVAREGADLSGFPAGGVLVAPNMATDFVVVMDRAAAIITDTGSVTGHLSALAREFQVPMIVDTGSATALLKDGQEITVDAIHCNVYEGRVEEILRFTAERSTFRDTHLFKILERVVDRVSPLNLVSPEAGNFKPANCMTYHDITRFSHEKAMAEMFLIGDDPSIEEYTSVPLRAGIPMDAHLIDLGGGLRERIARAEPGDIISIPFSVFLAGMMAMRWPEPRPSDVKGFLGMIANTAAIPEAELRETATRSYAILSRNYMNFSIRLGYHFSMVESYAGENLNDNYIKFFFKGGGAVTDRRLRRIRLITEILKKMDFRVAVKEDVMEASLLKLARTDIEKRLKIMGKLTAYTKQLDMVMYNDAVTDMFIEDFIREHVDDAPLQ